MTPSVETGRLSDEMLGGYADVVALAEGAHSTVHSAVEQQTGRTVALKVLNVDGATPRELEAFARESAVLAVLSTHPNIVTMYRSFPLSDGRPVLVLELCRESLAQRLTREGSLPVAEAVAMAVKLCGALETAHRGDVLHRDVRPENILITEYGEPALADFGVARLRTSVPATAELFEFPGPHAAPELLLAQEASEATDVYGLASTLYQMLTGAPPMVAYSGESTAETILRILRDPPRPIERHDVPYALSDLVLWALAKDPAQRPPGSAWFAEELARIESRSNWGRTASLIREPADPVRTPGPLRHAVRLTRQAGRAQVPARQAAGPPPAPEPLPPVPAARASWWRWPALRGRLRALAGRRRHR